MKNPTRRLKPSWGAALPASTRRCAGSGMAEKTRRAYGVDLGQLAEWAEPRIAARRARPRLLRRFAGVLSERGASKSTVARKLAAIRSFYR